MSSCPLCDRVASQETRPNRVIEFDHSVLFVGDHQVFPGYCVLVAKAHCREQHDLAPEAAIGLYKELLVSCRAIEQIWKPWKLNLSSYGNLVPHVHWHIMPRYQNDPQRLVSPWLQMDRFNHHRTSPEQATEVAEKIRSVLQNRAKTPG